jgi:hypothetical protein
VVSRDAVAERSRRGLGRGDAKPQAAKVNEYLYTIWRGQKPAENIAIAGGLKVGLDARARSYRFAPFLRTIDGMALRRGQLRIECMDDTIAAVLKGRSPAECVAMIGEANETARILAAAGVRHLHPDWSDAEVQAEVASRMLCCDEVAATLKATAGASVLPR